MPRLRAYSRLSLLLSLAAACGTSERENPLDPPAWLGLDSAAGGGASCLAPDAGMHPKPSAPSTLDASIPDASLPDASHDVTHAGGANGYRLALVQRYGVPMSNATGVACDGDAVWLVGGGHNAQTHTLVHVQLATSSIDKTFTFDNLIETAGTGVYGITQRQGEVFLAVAGHTNKVVAVDPDTGKIRRTFQGPSVLGPADLDLSDEGQLVESTGTGEVYTLDPQTGAVRGSFAVGDENRDNGVAVRGKQAFVGRLFGGMQVFNLSDGKLLGRVTHLDGRELDQTRDLGSMCFRGSHLLILSSLGLSEYELRDSQ
jgi:hypothetical protein